MATYKFKQDAMTAINAGAVAHFTSPIQGIGYSLELSKATPDQLEKLYLLGHAFVEKVETANKKGE